jgi:hypothetical protein
MPNQWRGRLDILPWIWRKGESGCSFNLIAFDPKMPLAAFPFNCPPTADPYCYMSYATQSPQTGEAFYAQIMYDVTIGIPEHVGHSEVADQVVVYPNPSGGMVAVQLGPAWAATGPPLVQVYDATGKLLMAPAPHPHTGTEAITMDLGKAGPGIRFIRIRSADGLMDVTRSILLQ